MPKAGLSHRIRLRTTADANDVGLNLHELDDGTLAYGWDLAPALAPDVEQKDVNYGEFRQELQLTWSQSDWSGGGLQFYYNPERPNRYGIASDCWSLTRNEATAGARMEETTFGVRKGGQESGGGGGGGTPVGSGVTQTINNVESSSHTGYRSWRGTSWTQNGTLTFTIEMTDQPATRWQSQDVSARARVASAGTAATFRINIVETGGVSTPTTNGAGVSISGTSGVFATVLVNVQLQSDTTAIDVQIERTDAGASASYNVDGVQFFAGRALGQGPKPNPHFVPMMEFGADVLLAFTQNAIWKFNGDEDYWMLQKNFGADITGAAIFDDRLYIGQGESTAYEFSDVADPTTFTTSTLTSTQKNANRFIVTQNVNGNKVLAKTLNDNELFLAKDPTNSGDWGSALDVSTDDYNITNVHQIGDAIAVGKEDGLYQYLSLEGDRLNNIFPDAVAVPSVDNFARGVNHAGQFYTAVGEQGFMRWNGVSWETLGHLISSPGFAEIGSRVRAFGTDGQRLYLLVEEPVAGSLTKTCWLLALREFADGTWDVHTLVQFVCTDGSTQMIVSKATETIDPHLYVSGSIEVGGGFGQEAFIWRYRLPAQTDNPRHAQNPQFPNNISQLTTSYMDWNRPNVLKAFNRLTVLSENLSAGVKWTVQYEIDDDVSFTLINTSSSVFDVSPSETISFNTGVTGRRIRLKLTGQATASSTPILKGFFLEASWRPGRLKRWQVTCDLEDGQLNLMGVPTALTAQVTLASLKTLEAETSPLKFDDIDGTANNVHITNMGERMIVPVLVEAGQGGKARYKRVIDLELTEAF